MSTDDIGVRERWENYRKANNQKPLVRDNELKEIYRLLNPTEGEVILEVGTGNGYLTFPIANAVGNGKVITADIGGENLQSVVEKNTSNLPIETLQFNDEDGFPSVQNDSLDAVGTIATLHHFDNRTTGTGENGRKRALTEFYRVLKGGGRLVIADVAYGTISQKYFDSINNPEHCFPDGHPHDFFTIERLKKLLEEVGFKNINIEVKTVAWQFTSEDEAKNFVHTIHNAKCSVDDSFELAKQYLGFNEVDYHYELGWELYFATATK